MPRVILNWEVQVLFGPQGAEPLAKGNCVAAMRGGRKPGVSAPLMRLTPPRAARSILGFVTTTRSLVITGEKAMCERSPRRLSLLAAIVFTKSDV